VASGKEREDQWLEAEKPTSMVDWRVGEWDRWRKTDLILKKLDLKTQPVPG